MPQLNDGASERTEVTFNYEGGDCTLAEFLESNLETLALGEVLKVARLSVGEVALIPVHCGFAQIVRMK